ncbi:MAG TPA: hypothetical protein VHO48_08780 [Anaerolineaceae bacterium]|jgi:hypothetical protein|nr:hypothetical protein [Anaerolineaceae bacterium]
MAGKIKEMIDVIVADRAKGNATIALTTRTKVMLKGVNPDLYTEASPDDPVIIAKVRRIGEDFGIHLS